MDAALMVGLRMKPAIHMHGVYLAGTTDTVAVTLRNFVPGGLGSRIGNRAVPWCVLVSQSRETCI